MSCTRLGWKHLHSVDRHKFDMYLLPECPQSWKDPRVFLKSLVAGGKTNKQAKKKKKDNIRTVITGFHLNWLLVYFNCTFTNTVIIFNTAYICFIQPNKVRMLASRPLWLMVPHVYNLSWHPPPLASQMEANIQLLPRNYDLCWHFTLAWHCNLWYVERSRSVTGNCDISLACAMSWPTGQSLRWN